MVKKENKNLRTAIIILVVAVAILILINTGISPLAVAIPSCGSFAPIGFSVAVESCETGEPFIKFGESLCWQETITAQDVGGGLRSGGELSAYAIDEEITNLPWVDIPPSWQGCFPTAGISRNALGGIRGRFNNRVEELLPGPHSIRFAAVAFRSDDPCPRFTTPPSCTFDVNFNIQPELCVLGAGQATAHKTFGPGSVINTDSLEGNFIKYCTSNPPFVVSSFTLTGSPDQLLLDKLRNGETITVPGDSFVNLFWIIQNPLAVCNEGEVYNLDLEICVNPIDIVFCNEQNIIALPDGGFICGVAIIQQCVEDSDCPIGCSGMTASCLSNSCEYSGQCEPTIEEIIVDCTSPLKNCPSGFECIDEGSDSGLCKKTEFIDNPTTIEVKNPLNAILVIVIAILAIIVIYLFIKKK